MSLVGALLPFRRGQWAHLLQSHSPSGGHKGIITANDVNAHHDVRLKRRLFFHGNRQLVCSHRFFSRGSIRYDRPNLRGHASHCNICNRNERYKNVSDKPWFGKRINELLNYGDERWSHAIHTFGAFRLAKVCPNRRGYVVRRHDATHQELPCREGEPHCRRFRSFP